MIGKKKISNHFGLTGKNNQTLQRKHSRNGIFFYQALMLLRYIKWKTFVIYIFSKLIGMDI